MHIEADAQFYQHPPRRVAGATPLDGRWVVDLTWESGKIAYIYDRDLLEYYGKRRYKRGQLLEYAGVPVRVIDPKPEEYFGILVVKVEGWWTLGVCVWFSLKRLIYGVNMLLLRTAWAWGLLVLFDMHEAVGWRHFRLYRWLWKIWKGQSLADG